MNVEEACPLTLSFQPRVRLVRSSRFHPPKRYQMWASDEVRVEVEPKKRHLWSSASWARS
jgi:hypothetical protein